MNFGEYEGEIPARAIDLYLPLPERTLKTGNSR